MRITLPISKELDVGFACEIWDLETLFVFLELQGDDLFQLELTLVGRPTWPPIGFELVKLVIVSCEEVSGDEGVHSGKIWQSINVVRKHENESGETVDLGI